MDLKAKLVGIIQNSVGGCARHWAEVIADDLIAHGVTVQEWISVKDRLPEEDTGKVLCITKSGHYHILQWIETFNCWSDPYGIDFTNFRNGYVAYWMPLPQPPKGE